MDISHWYMVPESVTNLEFESIVGDITKYLLAIKCFTEVTQFLYCVRFIKCLNNRNYIVIGSAIQLGIEAIKGKFSNKMTVKKSLNVLLWTCF